MSADEPVLHLSFFGDKDTHYFYIMNISVSKNAILRGKKMKMGKIPTKRCALFRFIAYLCALNN